MNETGNEIKECLETIRSVSIYWQFKKKKKEKEKFYLKSY